MTHLTKEQIEAIARLADRIEEADGAAIHIAPEAAGAIREWLATRSPPSPQAGVPDVDWLANVIRTVDGGHALGAEALAEKIVEALAAAPQPPAAESRAQAAGMQAAARLSQVRAWMMDLPYLTPGCAAKVALLDQALNDLQGAIEPPGDHHG